MTVPIGLSKNVLPTVIKFVAKNHLLLNSVFDVATAIDHGSYENCVKPSWTLLSHTRLE